MTTICVANNVMAADSQTTRGRDIINSNADKITIVDDGAIGIAGQTIVGDHFLEWLRGDRVVWPNMNKISVLHLKADGRLFSYEQTNRWTKPYPIELQQPAAIGSGRHLGLGAILAGKSAAESVVIASQIDAFTNVIVKTYKPDGI